jgi:hypothetical protein
MADAGNARTGYGAALLAFVVLFAAVMAPFWWRGEVIAPDRQQAALGLPLTKDATHPQNPLFSDYSSVYVPEVAALQHAPRSGWLATWDPYNEVGRPLYHDAGQSPAYLPTRLLFALFDDPRAILTALSVGMALLAGLFAFGLAREARLHPVACFVAAKVLGLGPPVLFWLAFPMFHAVLTWACGCLYAVAWLQRAPSLAGWALLSFCTYSLLMTGYQQDIVLHAYLLAGFGALATMQAWRVHGTTAAMRFVVLCGSAVASGLAAALPVYLDLWVRAQESARLALGAEFFLGNLPRAGTWPELQRLLAGIFFQDLFGNPASPHFEWGVGDMSLPPLSAALVAGAVVMRWRRAAGWWAVVAACTVLTFWHPAYRFAVEHLGLGLSFSNPMFTALIPLAMLAGHGADALLGGEGTRLRRTLAVALGAVLLASTATLAWRLARDAGVAPQTGYLGMAMAAVAVLGVAVVAPKRAVLAVAALAAVSAWVHGRELLLTQPPARIASDSPLVQDLRRALPAGGRYAFVGELHVLPPNMNATFGLASVHTYNSLSSRRYQALVETLGGRTRIHGRHNRAIAPDYDAPAVALAGIAVVGSPVPVSAPQLQPLASATRGVHLYRVTGFHACCARLPRAPGPGPDLRVGTLADADWNAATLRVDAGDRLEFDLAPRSAESVLILDRGFHPHWSALAGDGQPLRTLAADGTFLAVALPPGTRSVTVEFRPYARLAWLGQAFYLGLAMAMLVLFVRRRRLRLPSSSRPGSDA